MTKEIFIDMINKVLNAPTGFGFDVFACIKKDGVINLHSFILEDNNNGSFKDSICDKIKACIIDRYLCENFILDQIDDIHDNRNVAYAIPQTEEYSPFGFIETITDCTFSDADKNDLYGFAFRYKVDENQFWAYQQVYPITLPHNKKGVYVFKKDKVYKQFDKELLRIDYRIDVIIIDKVIVSSNINLLQGKFNFETLIRNESSKTIQSISSMGIIADMTKIINFEGKEKLTNAKKLMKICKSPVLSISKDVLIERLTTLPRFMNRLTIEDNLIKINSNNDVIELLKILNDDYLKSELTEKPYESSSKTLSE